MRIKTAAVILSVMLLGGCAGTVAFPNDDQFSVTGSPDTIGAGDSVGCMAHAGSSQHVNPDATAQIDTK